MTSRAESLAGVADYLFDAVIGLDGASRALDRMGALGAADQARGLHDRVRSLHAEIRRAALTAHRAERPEVYDDGGRWVGR